MSPFFSYFTEFSLLSWNIFLLQYDGIIVIWALSEQQNFSSLLLNFFQILFKIFLCIKISKYSTCSSIHGKHVCYLYLLCLDKVGNIKMWSWPYSDVIKTNRLFSSVIKWNLRYYRLYKSQQSLQPSLWLFATILSEFETIFLEKFPSIIQVNEEINRSVASAVHNMLKCFHQAFKV